MARLLVDGVFYQLNNTGIARVWSSILPIIAARGDIEVMMLDRGNAPELPGVRRIPFPRYTFAYGADDSALVQKVCDHYRADAFTSTYYTTPLATPMLLMVYDMIPELFDFDLTQRGWLDKEATIAFAQRYVCISHTTRRDLLCFYPEIPGDRAVVAHCGVDRAVFHARQPAEVAAFRARHGLERPYFLFVGSRVQHKGYKNSQLFFDTLGTLQRSDFDVLCAGGEPTIDAAVLERLPKGMRCIWEELSDDDLSIAYAGATALVYPSLYEGFGMPVIEAMASGCPSITTHHGSLAEAAGDAAYFIDGFSMDEMRDAIERALSGAGRADLVRRGLAHVEQFRWEAMAEVVARETLRLVDESRQGLYDEFLAEWTRLRAVQAAVDLLIP